MLVTLARLCSDCSEVSLAGVTLTGCTDTGAKGLAVRSSDVSDANCDEV